MPSGEVKYLQCPSDTLRESQRPSVDACLSVCSGLACSLRKSMGTYVRFRWLGYPG